MIFEMQDIIRANTMDLTRHATRRFAQRGFRRGDAEHIIAIGTEVEGGFIVRRKDVQSLPSDQRRLVGRLVGMRLVVADNSIVTGYRATKGKQHRLLRNWKLVDQGEWK